MNFFPLFNLAKVVGVAAKSIRESSRQNVQSRRERGRTDQVKAAADHRRECARRFQAQGHTVEEMSTELGVSVSTVRKYLRDPGQSPNQPNPEWRRDAAIRLHASGVSSAAIASAVGLDESEVRRCVGDVSPPRSIDS